MIKSAAANPYQATGKLAEAPTESVSDLRFCFSQPKLYLGCSSYDGSIKIWTIDMNMNGKLIFEYKEEKNAITRFCFSIDGSHIFIALATGEIKMIKVEDKTTTEIGSHKGIIIGIDAISADEIAAASTDQSVEVWDIKTKKSRLHLELKAKPTFFIAKGEIKHYNKTIALGVATLNNGKIANLDLTDGKQISEHPATISGQLTSVSMSFDGKLFAIGSSYGLVEIRDSSTSKGIYHLHKDTNTGNAYPSNRVAFDPGHPHVISGGGEPGVGFINTEKKTTIERKFDSPVTAVAFAPIKSVYAIAVGYDYSKGGSGAKSEKVEIYVKQLGAAEI